MTKHAFCDPITGVLKCHGYVDGNDLGDLVLEVDEGFDLTPRRWRWTGTAWQKYTPPPPSLAAIAGARVGSLTISDTANTGQVVFPSPLPDDTYKVFPTVSGFTGTPASAARIVNINGNTKSVNGFTLVLAAAPGAGNSVTVDFLVIKVAPTD